LPSEKTREKMIEELTKRNVPSIGMVSYDLELNEAGFEGKVISDSKATIDIQAIIERLLDEVKQSLK
jgi:CO dehydrogenase nickel-insertion accessory protein CooC1